jgi:hypothetical protein
MAAQISHIIAGEKAIARAAGQDGISSLGDAASFFRLGCQGPDIFYHNRRTMPSGLHYGALAHRRGFGSLVAGAAASLPSAEREATSASGAYLLGLATHAAVDRATHPFIIYFSGWALPSDPGSARFRGCHPFLERLLDIGLLAEELGISPRDYGLSSRLGLDRPVDREAADAALVALWAAGLRAAYPRATAADHSLEIRIANALADARNFYALTDPGSAAPGDPRGGALALWLKRLGAEEGRRLISLVYPERIPLGLDPMNLAGSEWEHPSGIGLRSRASYLDLMAKGAADAARAIARVLGFWKGELSAQALARELGEGGLAFGDASGDALPPRISRPLALSEAMDAEYAAHVDLSAPTG